MDDARLEFEAVLKTQDDIDLESILSEDEDYESSPAEYEISTYPADFTLEVLWSKWRSGDIEIPKFQRRFVWKQIQASKLIESFLAGLPVPAVFLYTDRTSQKQLVIDGQQRLRSVFYYFEGYFGEQQAGSRTVFTLKGLGEESRWNDKSFEDLDEPDQRRLKNSVLRAFIVQQVDPKDDTSMYHVFERLNTGGTFLTNQEVRNCVYWGTFNDLLQRLNEYPPWRAILGKKVTDSRQKDVELILRFFSLAQLGSEYEKPMKEFMSRFMAHNRNPSTKFLNQAQGLFEKTTDLIHDQLGEKPFHIKRGVNSAVLDSVMTVVARRIDSVKRPLRSAYDRLLDDSDFQRSVAAGTTDEESVKRRLARAEHFLIQG